MKSFSLPIKPGILLVVLALFTITVALRAQQQYSGGQSVTVTQGGNSAQVTAGGLLKVDASGATVPVSGTFWQATQPVSGTVTASNTAFALNAGTNKVGVTYPYTSCGTTAFTQALAAMPTSSTAITATTTCVLTLTIANTTGSPLNITVSDNQGTPVNFLNAFALAGGATSTYTFPNGAKFTSGIKVLASGAGVTYSVEGLQ